MLMELCVGNYETSNGFVNGVNGIFENLQKLFQNLLFGYIFIILKSDIIHELKIYKSIMRLDKQWTPIECKIVEIQIGNNPSHTITRIQFPIQLVTS
jgi:hypothetical protein